MSDTSSGQWVCLSIDIQCLRSEKFLNEIKVEINNIFGKDLCDIVIMADKLSEDAFEMQLENYMFVKVKNYFDHVKQLKESKKIFGVLDTYESPSFLPDEEVIKFKSSMQVKFGHVDELKVGDLVVIKEGHLKNLKGVILKVLKDNKYRVFFKLYTHSFTRTLWRNNMILENNVFNIFKNNRKVLKLLGEETDNADKVRRSKHRKIGRKQKLGDRKGSINVKRRKGKRV